MQCRRDPELCNHLQQWLLSVNKMTQHKGTKSSHSPCCLSVCAATVCKLRFTVTYTSSAQCVVIQHNHLRKGAKRALVGATSVQAGGGFGEELHSCRATVRNNWPGVFFLFFLIGPFDEASWLSSDIFHSDAM